jgi:phosphoribosyl-dephospho-CoA transferase
VTPARHDRVWLRPGWRAFLRVRLSAAASAAADEWLARGLPAVAARREVASGDAIPLGIALPGRRRIALAVAPEAIARTAPPLLLSEAIPSAPAEWRAALTSLDVAAQARGLSLRLHGSLAWQHLSGDAYVGPESDVDLLVAPRSADGLAAALALLAAHPSPPRLDGEVLLPGGRGVAWRELLAGSDRLLVKSTGGVALEPARTALEALR